MEYVTRTNHNKPHTSGICDGISTSPCVIVEVPTAAGVGVGMAGSSAYDWGMSGWLEARNWPARSAVPVRMLRRWAYPRLP